MVDKRGQRRPKGGQKRPPNFKALFLKFTNSNIALNLKVQPGIKSCFARFGAQDLSKDSWKFPGSFRKNLKEYSMKHIGNFLVGTLSSLGVSAALPDAVNSAATAAPTVIDSIEALISLISGLLSAFLVAWLKRKWEKSQPQAGK